MKSWIRGVAWLVALLVTATGTIVAAPNNVRPSSSTAQTGWTPPPTIISFSSDVQQLSLADVEAGHTTTRLSWQTVGVGPEHVLTLYGYRVNGWEPLRPDETRSLPDSGSTDIVITHPLTFGPPTYSLIITDAAGQTLDQRVLIIPYARPTTSEPPVIDTFTSPVTTLDAAALADGTARLSITWDVRGRPPCSHLIFEQVLESGAVVPVDLPRPNLWVPSAGEGVLAPVQTVSGLPVRLRLRVVDMADGSTLAEQALPPIPVIQGAATATTAATQPPFSAGAAAVPPVKIVSFIAAPETIPRGSAVTVTWDVQNAVSLGVWLAEPDGALAQQAPDPAPQGSWTVAVPESYVDQATFRLFATGSDGNAVESTVVVDIICPYTYFFDHPDEQLSCPLDNAATVQAAFQR